MVRNTPNTREPIEDGEDINVQWIDLAKAKDMALGGLMSEERSALVLLRFLNML